MIAICLTIHKQVPFVVIATNCICDNGIGSILFQVLTLYYYDKNGNRQDNITDWSLQKFQTHYNNKKIKKLDIFHYTYAVLHQYKEKKPRDKTIAEKFNTYCFADYKETVIDLLQKVCTVSVETMKIIQVMET